LEEEWVLERRELGTAVALRRLRSPLVSRAATTILSTTDDTLVILVQQ
jgi:hypothetical protein